MVLGFVAAREVRSTGSSHERAGHRPRYVRRRLSSDVGGNLSCLSPHRPRQPMSSTDEGG